MFTENNGVKYISHGYQVLEEYRAKYFEFCLSVLF